MKHNREQFIVYIVLLVSVIAAQIISPGYLSITHVAGILRLASFLGIAAIGQQLAILTGGIDLSVGYLVTFANVIGAQMMMSQNANILKALFIVTAFGALIGIINATGIRLLKMQPFIITLGTGMIVKGIYYLYTNGAPKGNAAPLLTEICGKRMFGIVSGVVILWAVLAAIVIVVLKYTTLGRKLYAVGANEKGARFAGIHTGKIIYAVYIISAICSVWAGFLLVGYTKTSFLNVGDDYSMNAVASVVLGGTAITGGKGGYVGTIAGAVFMIVLEDILSMLGYPTAIKGIVRGAAIIVLVILYSKKSE